MIQTLPDPIGPSRLAIATCRSIRSALTPSAIHEAARWAVLFLALAVALAVAVAVSAAPGAIA